jgi:integrase
MTWRDAVRAWLEFLTGGGASRATLRLRRYQLLRLAADIHAAPAAVTSKELARWLAGMHWSRETRRSHIAALRGFFQWLLDEGVRPDDPTTHLPILRPVDGVPRPAPETVVSAALHAPAERVRLMVQLAAWHGLRRGEIALVAREDVMPSPGGWSLVVHGKGGKDRVVPLLDATAAALRTAPAHWAFPNGHGSHLSAGHVGVLISRELPRGVTTHMLRHRFATVVYRRTLDIRNLQRLLGHASVATTQRYAAPDDAQLRTMVQAAAA